MASSTLIFLLVSATFLSLVACLPLGAYPSGTQNSVQSSSSSHSLSPNPSLNPNPTSTYPYRYHWYRVSYRRTNPSESLPHLFYSGPWDRAWEMWTNVGKKFELFKRHTTPEVEQHRHHVKRAITNPRVQEAIANHLRPNTWWQKLKDFYRRITFRRLEVIPSQAERIKQKYRSGMRAYTSEDRRRGRFRPT
ncbi:uncharacterized protein UTRI_02975 [Ustilago trichophora]|uniref:Uncharacterized protein n=1 Tax=Ustilago trichophora TaxID=86804 RepID=A0A5C3EPF0_9BASI|nr:uncharacterized protein UTRI_02975 [Ustilago trichophora]